MVKKWIIMFVLSTLLVCLSECLTGEKKPAAEITQTGAASELSDQSQGETVTLSELSDKSQGETAVLSELSGKLGEDTDVPQEEWKKAYEEKLDKLYERKKDERWYSYTVRDLDGNGVPELILRSPGKTTGSKITVYSYEQGIKKIGKHHFIGGTTVLLVTDHPSYPGIIYFQVGGGLEYYSYLSMVDQTLHTEELWNEDYSGISQELGKDRERIQEISKDSALIQESKKAYETRTELLFQELSQHNEIEMLEGKMVTKPDSIDVVYAFEDWVNKLVWLFGKDIYIGEQEYLDRDIRAEIYYKRLNKGKSYGDPVFETYLYFPYKSGKRYECFTFAMGMHGFSHDPVKRDSDCKSVAEGLTYLGTEECYCSSEYPEQPYYLLDKKTALLERIQQQLTEEFLSRDEEEDPWKQYEIYISDFDVNAGYTAAIFIIDQKKVEVCRCLTWNVMLDNGKTSDQIALSKFDPGPMKDWTDPKVREDYQEMLDASICHFVIER